MAFCRNLDTSLTSPDMREFSFRLMNSPMYVPDILHDVKKVLAAATEMFEVCQQPYAIVDGDNKIGGAFFISNVIPEHEGTLYAWCWEPKAITATTLPFIDDYIRSVADEYVLCRITARTPDKKLCHLLEHLGFKEEGRFKFGYRSGGKSLTLFQMRRLFGRS